jgi:hypothetical protein
VPSDAELSIVAQCRLLKVARSSLYWRPAAVSEDEISDRMSLAIVPVRFLERGPDDGDVDQHLVMLLLPALILFQNLVAHVDRNSFGPCLFTSLWIVSDRAAFHDIGSVDQLRIRPRVELKRGDGDERELDVAARGPGEVLRLLDLHGELHARLHALHPSGPGVVVPGIAFVDLGPDG